MQPIAAWLVARPLNGGLALTVSWLLLPIVPLFALAGGMVITHVVLARGVRVGVLQAASAGTVLVLLALVATIPVGLVVTNVAIISVPVIVLAALMRQMRSLTLVFQVSVIIAAAAVVAFFVVLGDPAVYWNGIIEESVRLFREAGAADYADRLIESQSAIVPQMTMLMVFVGWSVYTLVLLLGYMLYQALPGQTAIFGCFRDLNFGRVVAGVMAVASVLVVLTGAVWLQNVALLILVTFWMQGLAIMHWLLARKRLPTFVLIATYALLVPFSAIIVVALSILGYLDAWFNFRARGAVGQA